VALRERDLAWCVLARGYSVDLVRSRYERARADAAASLRLRPLWHEPWVDMGWIRHNLGDNEGAREAFTRAAELDPARQSVGDARLEFFRRMEEPQAFIEELRRIRRYNPQLSLAGAVALAQQAKVDRERVESLASSPAESQQILDLIGPPPQESHTLK
jgi:tetratricopeptide (TPR) repeat protein